MKILEDYVADMRKTLLSECTSNSKCREYIYDRTRKAEEEVIELKAKVLAEKNKPNTYLDLYNAYKELSSCLRTSQTSDDA